MGLKAGEHDNDIVKIVIKGIPLSKGNDLISEFLGQQNINLRKPIQNGKLRDKNNTLLNVFSGDRIAYVDKFSKPLPRRARIGDNIALIYHKGQSTETPLCTNCFQKGHLRKSCPNPTACMLCKEPGHKAGDECCIAKAKKAHKTVIPFQGHTDPLSNFYPVQGGISIFGQKLPTAEHGYQYSKAMQSGQDITAKIILESKNGKIAKDEAAFMPYNPDWSTIKQETMKQVLEAKAKSCPEFKTALLKTENNILAEAVRGDYYWSTGLDKDLLMSTKKRYWPGQNVMGKLLCELRTKLRNIEKTEKKTIQSQKTSKKNNVTDSESDYEY